MLKFSEIFEFSRENSYFERIRMVRMVRMVRSLADRTFQLCHALRGAPAALFVRGTQGLPAVGIAPGSTAALLEVGRLLETNRRFHRREDRK